jgi:hypothetical protein
MKLARRAEAVPIEIDQYLLGQRRCQSAAKSVKLGLAVIASPRFGSQLGFLTDRRILRFSNAAWMHTTIQTSITSFGKTQLKSQPPHFSCWLGGSI